MRLIHLIVRLGLALCAFAPVAAFAHPHVFVDAKAELVFDKDGHIASVRNIWQFDKAFTAFAVQGLDKNNDGKLSDEELRPLAKVNIESLKEYAFFTFLTLGKQKFPFIQPTEYWLEFRGGRLTLFFTLPLKAPVPVTQPLRLEVFDPDYFVAFTFVKDKPITLVGAPPACHATYNPPHELDNATMAKLAAIPADEHDLPPELEDAALGLANLISVACG